MAWDTEGTRRRLLAAATAEFADHGPDGTTMTRIAELAGVNKERLYSYFGDKRALWETVLTAELDRLAASVALTGAGLDDIGAFAGATFDFHAANPRLARLLQWEGLVGGEPAAAAARGAHYREKVERFAGAQSAGLLDATLDAAHIVFALIALAAWWQTVPQLVGMITEAEPGDEAELARRRAFVVEVARRMAAPKP
ncbi:MAG: TetR family transcriptional regulator [Acidobacteria bacterium]|nr:TetR family transcriptional regulator [Acidobacteriota bacterium]